MNIELYFSPDEMVELFRSAGLNVEFRKTQCVFDYICDEPQITEISAWMVQNPNTLEWDFIPKYFNKYIQMKKRELFLDEDNKLKIINLFDK